MTPRNARCPCGNSLRFKQCCGRLPSSPPATAPNLFLALQAQQAGDFVEAVRRYDQHLALAPGDFDALHMRAVALLQLGCVEESRVAFLELMARHEVLPRPAWANLGMIAAALHEPEGDARATAALQRYRAWRDEVGAALSSGRGKAPGQPAIGVVVASYNHARFIEDALQSIAGQTRLPDELVVIDDGSSDDSPERISKALRRFPSGIRVEFLSRENRGAAESLNEAIGRLSTPWVAPLNSDDLFDRERLERLSDAAGCLGGLGVEFMFGDIALIDADGQHMQPPYSSLARTAMAAHRSIHMHHSVGLGLLAANSTVSSGNQFFTRRLWAQLGGYRPLRYNHDWDFALRASAVTEPVPLPDARYFYRIHQSNTIAAGGGLAQREARELLKGFMRSSCSGATGPHAPTYANWGAAFLAIAGSVDALEDVPHPAGQAFFLDTQRARHA